MNEGCFGWLSRTKKSLEKCIYKWIKIFKTVYKMHFFSLRWVLFFPEDLPPMVLCWTSVVCSSDSVIPSQRNRRKWTRLVLSELSIIKKKLFQNFLLFWPFYIILVTNEAQRCKTLNTNHINFLFLIKCLITFLMLITCIC